MNELEISILIVVSFLLLISVSNMVISQKRYKHIKYNCLPNNEYAGMRGGKRAPGLEGYNGGSLSNTTDWAEEIQKVGVDPATKFSHHEWTSELLGRTTGASPWTVMDHDINSNWLGLGWGKTWKQVYAQPGARVSESNDWQDMPSNPSLRWRCHEYIADPVVPSDCPWPPATDSRFST